MATEASHGDASGHGLLEQLHRGKPLESVMQAWAPSPTHAASEGPSHKSRRRLLPLPRAHQGGPQSRHPGTSLPDAAASWSVCLLICISGVHEFVFAPGCCSMWTRARVCVLNVHTSANVYMFLRVRMYECVCV